MKGALEGNPGSARDGISTCGVEGVQNRATGSHELGLEESGMSDDDDPDI